MVSWVILVMFVSLGLLILRSSSLLSVLLYLEYSALFTLTVFCVWLSSSGLEFIPLWLVIFMLLVVGAVVGLSLLVSMVIFSGVDYLGLSVIS